MDATANGVTLEGLARRLEALERENERMRSENAELRGKVATLEGSQTPPEDEPLLELENRQVSRRQLLSKAGVAAAGLVVAGALTQRDIREAKAAQVIGDVTAAFQGAVEGTNNGSQGYGVVGRAPDGWGVEGQGGRAGVRGRSQKGLGVGVQGIGGFTGVLGDSDQAGSYGVTGRSTNTDGTGVRGIGAGKGVRGESTNGIGVYGKGKHGLYGESSTAGVGAVEGHNSGGGHGVAAVGRVGLLAFSHENGWIGAWGRHTANGIGVAGDSAQGTGVSGSSTSGYGGQFDGGKAQLRLVPKGTAGKPGGSHTKGEIYMDSAGTMFICVASSTSTAAAKWRKVSTTAV